MYVLCGRLLCTITFYEDDIQFIHDSCIWCVLSATGLFFFFISCYLPLCFYSLPLLPIPWSHFWTTHTSRLPASFESGPVGGLPTHEPPAGFPGTSLIDLIFAISAISIDSPRCIDVLVALLPSVILFFTPLAAGLTSSFIFSLTRYYHGLATVREAEEMLQPGWQERYGYRAPVDTPADLEEEWNIWSYFGWKKDAPSTEAENGAGQQPHARGEGHLPPVSGGKSTAEDGEEAGFWSFFGSKKRADPAAQEANAPPPTTENNQPRKA